MEFKTGDRVKVSNLILDEPCSEVEELRDKVGTVQNPDVDDTDYDGNPCKVVQVKLDEFVSGGGWPEEWANVFVFKAEELEKI